MTTDQNPFLCFRIGIFSCESVPIPLRYSAHVNLADNLDSSGTAVGSGGTLTSAILNAVSVAVSRGWSHRICSKEQYSIQGEKVTVKLMINDRWYSASAGHLDLGYALAMAFLSVMEDAYINSLCRTP